MRTRAVHDGGRRAGTSVKLTTFAVLEEEDEIMRPKDSTDEEAKRAIDLGNLKEQAERMKGMNWADIAEEEEFEGLQRDDDDLESSGGKSNSGGSDAPEDEGDEQPVEVVLDIKPEKAAQHKSKKAQNGKEKDNFDDLIANLAKMNVSTAAGTTDTPSPESMARSEAATAEREKAKAQLRAKIAASATSRRKPVKEEETRKKTKSEKKEARKQFER